MKQTPLYQAVMLVALLAAPLVAMGPVGAEAGTGVYDMSRLINEPHPFANAGPVPPSVQPAPFVPLRRVQPLRPVQPLYRVQPSPRIAAAPRQIAAAQPVARVSTEEKGFLTFAGGYYDINDNEDAAEFRVEWKGHKWIWGVKPIVGLMASSDGAIYGYAGIGWDLFFGHHIVATPSFATGAYTDGKGKDLGSAIEFRSALELAWRFDNDTRLGVMVYHLSNAGITSKNPGTEVLSFGLSVPLN
jgi:lipid A 3-O-deacylase